MVKKNMMDACASVLRRGAQIPVRPRSLAKRVKYQLAYLTKEAKRCLSAEEPDAFCTFLIRSIPTLQLAGEETLALLKRCPKLPCSGLEGVPDMYLLYAALCTRLRRPLAQKDIVWVLKMMSKERCVTLAEIDVLPALVKAALINSIYEICREEAPAPGRMLFLTSAGKSLQILVPDDFDAAVESFCPVERVFLKDPSGMYPLMDRETKKRYRRRVYVQAEREKLPPAEKAKEIVLGARGAGDDLHRHIGFYLPENAHKSRLVPAVFVLPAVLSALCTAAACALWGWEALFLFPPLWGFLRMAAGRMAVFGKGPKQLPALAHDGSVPEEHAVTIALHTVLPHARNQPPLFEQLEEMLLTNGQGAVQFCLLADLSEEPKPRVLSDKTDIKAATQRIIDLNKKYGERFFMLVRPRVFCKTQDKYSSREQKRGAVCDLVRIMQGEDIPIIACCGELRQLRRTEHLFVMDAGTHLSMNAVAALSAAARHPLNRPVINEDKGAVTSGYGILAPRDSVYYREAGKTLFSRILTGAGGLPPLYSQRQKLSQLAFHESFYSGCGLIDVNCFYRVLKGALPNERVTEYEPLESACLRVGLVSEAQAGRACPHTISEYTLALFRRFCGGWQNTAWLGRRVPRLTGIRENAFSTASKLGLLENALLSLYYPALLALLLGSVFMRGALSLAFSVFSLSAVAGIPFLSFLHAAFSKEKCLSRRYFSKVFNDCAAAMLQIPAGWLLLPAHAFIGIYAFFTSLWRITVTRRNLLQREPLRMARVHRQIRFSVQMLSTLSICCGIFLLSAGNTLFGKVAGACFALFLPLASACSRTAKEKPRDLSSEQNSRIYDYACSMWSYFEKYATEEFHYLPPAEVSEEPERVSLFVSPADIGSMLLGALCAKDFGLITADTLKRMAERTVSAVEQLPKWKGQLFCRYNRQTLEPAPPYLLNAEQSGVYAACLAVLHTGLCEYGAEDEEAEKLRRRVAILCEAVNFQPFVHPCRKLLYTDFDTVKEEPSEDCHAFYESEARLACFMSIAKRQAPAELWRRLLRPLAAVKGYVVPVSKTGGAAEYLLPHVFFPLTSQTVSYEAAKLCVHRELTEASYDGLPWGTGTGERDYPATALSFGGDSRTQPGVSPFVSFLVLQVNPQAALLNLQKLEKLHASGEYGFFSSLSFASEDSSAFVIEKRCTAAELGLSLAACANACKGNIVQKRFCSYGAARSALPLLDEPAGTDGARLFANIALNPYDAAPQPEEQAEGLTKDAKSSPKSSADKALTE